MSDQHDEIDSMVGEIEEVSNDISDVRSFDIPVITIFSILFFIVALQFFTRYVLNDSLGWTEEIARYFLILLGFVGGITCVRKGKHIFLEFAFHYIPANAIKPLVVLAELIVVVFWSYCGWLAIELAERTKSNMVSIELPKAIIYYFVSAGCFLMAAFAIANFVKTLRTSSDDVARSRLEGEVGGS